MVMQIQILIPKPNRQSTSHFKLKFKLDPYLNSKSKFESANPVTISNSIPNVKPNHDPHPHPNPVPLPNPNPHPQSPIPIPIPNLPPSLSNPPPLPALSLQAEEAAEEDEEEEEGGNAEGQSHGGRIEKYIGVKVKVRTPPLFPFPHNLPIPLHL